MNYGELLAKLYEFSPEQLQMNVTIQINDEYYPVNKLEFYEEMDVLDINHPFLVTVLVTEENE